MKNIKNTIKILVLGMVFFAGTGVAFASTSINTNALDLPTFRARNHTDLGPCVDACGWSTSINADAAETVSVIIYYHNSGDEVADNMTVKIGGTDGGEIDTATTVTLTGTVDADNASPSTGSATIHLSSAQSMSYIDNTLIYYPDQGDTYYSLSDANLFTTGASLGDIGTGWTHQGTVVAKFIVSNYTDEEEFACNDGDDNDGDGDVDMADDGCTSPTDDNEYNYVDDEGGAPSVSTLSEDNVDDDSALLRGDLLSTGGDTPVTVYFKMDDNDCDSLDFTTSTDLLYSTDEFSVTVNDLDSDTEYCYKAYAYNDEGSDIGGEQYFTTGDGDNNDSDLNITTDTATDTDENSATLRGEVEAGDYDVDNCWFEWGTDDNADDLDEEENVDCDVNDGDNEDFEETITGLDENETYYFRFCAEDTDGNEDCGSIRDFDTDDDNNNDSADNGDTADISTTIATFLTGSSAKLNGLMTDSGSDYTYGYFEWGTTTALNSRTADISLGNTDSDIAFGNFVIGLSPNTLYYFRACGKNDAGVDCGDILSFRTLATGGYTGPSNPVVVTTVTGTGTSRLMLEVTSPYEDACPSDFNDYTIKYKNISGRTLTDAVLRVTLPEGVTFRKSSAGEFTESDNTITVELETLDINEEGEVFVSGEVNYKATDDNEDILVTTAVMAYTYSNTLGQEDAIAYKIHNVDRCGNVLGAFALFGGTGFLPNTLLGWLLLILVVLALIYIGRRIARESSRNAHAHAPAGHGGARSVQDLPY